LRCVKFGCLVTSESLNEKDRVRMMPAQSVCKVDARRREFRNETFYRKTAGIVSCGFIIVCSRFCFFSPIRDRPLTFDKTSSKPAKFQFFARLNLEIYESNQLFRLACLDITSIWTILWRQLGNLTSACTKTVTS